MSQDNKADSPQAKERGGILRRLLGRGGMSPQCLMPIPDEARRPHSTSVIFRDSSSAVTGCRWCGISY